MPLYNFDLTYRQGVFVKNLLTIPYIRATRQVLNKINNFIAIVKGSR
jgi:hypothetical protein